MDTVNLSYLSPSTACISCSALTIAITLNPTSRKLIGVWATKLEQNKAVLQNDKLWTILGLLPPKARQFHAQKYLRPAGATWNLSRNPHPCHTFPAAHIPSDLHKGWQFCCYSVEIQLIWITASLTPSQVFLKKKKKKQKTKIPAHIPSEKPNFQNSVFSLNYSKSRFEQKLGFFV